MLPAIVVSSLLMLVPTKATATAMTPATSAIMRAYSAALEPDSSFRNLAIVRMRYSISRVDDTAPDPCEVEPQEDEMEEAPDHPILNPYKNTLLTVCKPFWMVNAGRRDSGDSKYACQARSSAEVFAY